MTTEAHKPLPESLADLALIDGPTAARVGSMSVSWWQKEVNAGRAPQPAVRSPRFTRWRLSEVRAFWQQYTAHNTINPQVIASAAKANAASRTKRVTAAA